MLLTQIDHVAIAVHDLEAAIDYHARAFGAEVCHREVVEQDGVEEAMVRVGESYLQLTTGIRTASPISQFAAIVAAGGRAIDEEPRPGSRGTTVAFVHPRGSFGTLIELVEEPR